MMAKKYKVKDMPIISVFYGIIIRIYPADHNPPHLHVQYAENEAIIAIKTGRILQGSLPNKARKLVAEWRRERLELLHKAWDDAQKMKPIRKIKPI